jgi:hypothetical protein
MVKNSPTLKPAAARAHRLVSRTPQTWHPRCCTGCALLVGTAVERRPARHSSVRGRCLTRQFASGLVGLLVSAASAAILQTVCTNGCLGQDSACLGSEADRQVGDNEKGDHDSSSMRHAATFPQPRLIRPG